MLGAILCDFPGYYLKKQQVILPRKSEYYQDQVADLQLKSSVPPWHTGHHSLHQLRNSVIHSGLLPSLGKDVWA